MTLSRTVGPQDFGSTLGYRTKTTMLPRINNIMKLRPYRQDPLGGVSNLLITKAINFGLGEPRIYHLIENKQ